MTSRQEANERFVVTVYADVDLNYLDGSSIWLVSLASVLSRLELDTHVVLKADIDRDLLTDEISSLPGVHLHEPSSIVGKRRLVGPDVVAAVEAFDSATPCRILVTRGRAATVALARTGRYDRRLWPYLTDIPQQPAEVTHEFLDAMDDVLARAGRVLCQTEQLRSFLASFFPEFDRKMAVLPPMIPDETGSRETLRKQSDHFRLFYGGKFAPAWGIEELVGAVQAVRSDHPEVELVVAGDKIHNPPADPGYPDRVRAALAGEGVTWVGALEREDVLRQLKDVDVAVSVRDTSLDSSRELSTKLLEYAAAGVPVIVNRTLMHQELLGDDYPLFVDGYEGLEPMLRSVADHPETLDVVRVSLAEVAAPHTYSAVAAGLQRLIGPEIAAASGPRLDGLRIGVASHDLKFAESLLEDFATAGASVRVDEWLGHDRHDAAHSRSIIEWADVIFAEWCLANAVWYSKHRRPDQRLYVRFHRTEIDSQWPPMLDIDGVTGIYFVGDHIKDAAAQRFGWPAAKLGTIANVVDDLAFDRPKLPGAEYNLGLLGFLPRLKRLDLALDLLEQLRSHDSRYRLVLKGVLPWELDWVWSDDDERAYFESQFARIRNSPLLGTAVTFDRAGPDVPSWFRKIGWILSPSDVESFHLAMIEGMLSAAVPVAIDRPGVLQIIGSDWVHEDVAAAVSWMRNEARLHHSRLGQAAQQQAHSSYHKGAAEAAWRGVFADLSTQPV